MIRAKLFCCVMLLTWLIASSGQISGGTPAPLQVNRFPPVGQRVSRDQDGVTREQQAAMEKARQQQRYKDMKRDSEKLLELATELKQQVDRSDENTLSLEVVRKAEQIEKLAHSVKTHMRGE